MSTPMRLFKLTTKDGAITLIIRGQCYSCARLLAAKHAGAEGKRVWYSRNLSDLEILNPATVGYPLAGPKEILERIEHD